MPRLSQQQLSLRANWWLALLAFGLVGIGLTGCKKMPDRHSRRFMKQHTPPRRVPTPKQRQALGRKLLSTLGIARSHHRRASIYEALGQLPKALSEIDAILKLSFPSGYRAGEEMLLDAWGRKALLQLKHKKQTEALATIEAALKRPTWLKYSFYKAQLYHIQGRILTQLKRPKEALAAYQRSIAHNKAVIQDAQKLLGKGVARPLTPGDPR